MLQEVLDDRRKALPDSDPEVQATIFALADALGDCGDMDRALELHQLVLEQRERLYWPGHPHLMMSQEKVAQCFKSEGLHDELEALALRYAEGIRRCAETAVALSARERGDVVRQGAARIDTLVRMLVYVDLERHSGLLFELIEGHRILSGRSHRLPGRRLEVAELRALQERVLASRSRLAALAGAAASENGASVSPRDLSVASAECEAAERAYTDGLVRRGHWYLERISIPRIARALPPDSIAVSYWRTDVPGSGSQEPHEVGREGLFFAQVLSRDGTTDTLMLGQALKIAKTVRRWRKEIGAPLTGDDTSGDSTQALILGKELRKQLLDPVLELAGSVSRIYIRPDDILHLVPLDALPLEEGTLVGERIQIRPLGFLSELVHDPPALDGQPSLLAIGAVDYGSSEPKGPTRPVDSAASQGDGLFNEFFPRLESSDDEVVNVALFFERQFVRPARMLRGAEASKAMFLKLAPGARYVHLATHGAFAEEDHRGADPELGQLVERMAPLSLCGLALSSANRGPDDDGAFPGILTGEEIAGLDLSACELAVLSACESGVGLRSPGVGLWSLQNGRKALEVASATWGVRRGEGAGAGRVLLAAGCGVSWAVDPASSARLSGR